MLGKFEFYWFFYGLMISEKYINKNNIKWLTRSCSKISCSSVFTKKTCVFALLNINCLGWIISDIKQKGIEYLLINPIWTKEHPLKNPLKEHRLTLKSVK